MRTCWVRGRSGGINTNMVSGVILVFGAIVQVLSGASVTGGSNHCDSVKDAFITQFSVSSQAVFAARTPEESLCGSASENSSLSCCPISLVEELVKSSNIVLSAFNNSEQFNRFKTKITAYDTVISSYNESNVELWNATVEGLRVLKNWGVKYWDPGYLHSNHVFSTDCVRKVVAGRVCGGCRGGEEPVVKPCKTLCHNVVVGCIKPLAEYIESPWKHAVNSVRTAIRLVITTGGDDKQNTQPLQDLVAELNDWREPITWWISEYKRTSSCEGLPSNGCWNGDSVGKYEFGSVNWRSQFNPEFSQFADGGGRDVVASNVIIELDRFRNELVGVRKSLEKYWPTAQQHNQQTRSSSPPHAMALSSSESVTAPRESYYRDLLEMDNGYGGGSGRGPIISDDEDLDETGSGYVPDSDDEDLGVYGSGYGSGDDEVEQDVGSSKHPSKVTDDPDNSRYDTTPTSVSGGCSLGVFDYKAAVLLIMLVCLI